MIINREGEFVLGIGEMKALAAIDANLIKKHQLHLERASMIVMDGNLPAESMKLILDIALDNKIPGEFEIYFILIVQFVIKKNNFLSSLIQSFTGLR